MANALRIAAVVITVVSVVAFIRAIITDTESTGYLAGILLVGVIASAFAFDPMLFLAPFTA